MIRAVVLALMSALVLATWVVWTRLVEPSIQADPRFLADNLGPELLGICLEGLLFVGLLSAFGEWRDHQSKRNLRRVLNGAIDRLRNGLNEAPRACVESFIEGHADVSHQPQHHEHNRQQRDMMRAFAIGIEQPRLNQNLARLRFLLDRLDSTRDKYLHLQFPVSPSSSEFRELMPLAALESPETLAKWHRIIELVRRAQSPPYDFVNTAGLRALADYLEDVRV